MKLRYELFCHWGLGAFFFLSWLSPDGMSYDNHNLCHYKAERAARLKYELVYDQCTGGGSEECRSDFDCPSNTHRCMEGRCIQTNFCSIQIRCDECFLGQRNCRIIDCQGGIRNFIEQCTAKNTYACGACQMEEQGFGNTGKFSYPVYLENTLVEQSRPFSTLYACSNAKATDPRCHGN